ncbi:MAG TPA: hypothetical protein VLA91_13525 [Acidimicrobiia bacterium]|nr:hypothetical protein [Acidimicrobiia bacterium]
MSFATHTHRRGFERFLTIFSAFAVLASLMVVFAPTALAHHPEISVQKICVDSKPYIHFDAISWKTDGSSGSGNSEIRIEVRVAGGGAWTSVTSDAFNAGNGYRFSGQFDASAYWGSSIQVRALAVGKWDNGVSGGDYRITGAVLVDQDCTDDVTVTPHPQVCEAVGGSALGGVSFDVAPASGATVQVYANSNYTGAVGGALGDDQKLDLAPGAYYWKATAAQGFELSGKKKGEFTIDPCVAAVAVSASQCVVNSAGIPAGSVSVTIDPTSGATVQVSGPGGPYDFSGSGGSEELAPGTYTWVATWSSGFQLTGEIDGEFIIDPCDASVVVASGQCVIADGPQGSVTATIDTDSGAVVTVYDEDLEEVAQFSGVGGSKSLAPGTYTWKATPGAGFEFPKGEVTSGEFTIDPCVGVVTVSHGNCQVNTATAFGSVTAVIDPTAAATVSVLDSASKLVASFTGAGGTETLQAGAYTWTAEAADGFTLDVVAGSFTVIPCPEEVLGNVIEVDDPPADEVEELVVLPFTGIDTSVLVMVSVILLGSGLYLLRTVTRRKEG